MNYSVYELLFPNNKRYIGITRQDPKKRWGHGSGYIGQMVYNPIKKYGWDNITHNILFTNMTREEACQKEKELIKKYKTTDMRYGYNLGEGGDCGSCMSKERHWTYNIPRPLETRQKISKTLTGRFFGIDNSHHTSVNQYTLEGEYIKTWDSLADIKRELGYKHAHIVECCQGRRKKAYGYRWGYLQKL